MRVRQANGFEGRDAMLTDLAHGELAKADHCFLTTIGRASRCTQTVELWFAVHHDTVYLLSGSGERAEWVRNLARHPEVELEIGRVRRTGRARLITDPGEDARARRLLVCKYQPRASRAWGESALAIAIDL
jgi:deazaflavin-dependent oxidoreductase (nitroreductase family)